MTAPTNAVLAEHARRLAEQHPHRTAERHAAAAAYIALRETSTIDAARRALGTLADPVTADAAATLLRELAEQDNHHRRSAP